MSSRVRDPLARGARAVRDYVRAGPLTTAVLVVLLAAHAWLSRSPRRDGVVAAVSTNLDNLADHPVRALAGSLLFFDGSLVPGRPGFGGVVITLVLGIGVAMWWLEARRGSVRAGAALVVGHVGATLVTAVVIVVAVRSGRYPAEVRAATDYGISYGSEAVLAAVTPLLPRRARVPWVAFVLAWPLADADWSGLLPDFTTVGHLVAAALGFGLGVLPGARRGQRRSAGSVGSGEV